MAEKIGWIAASDERIQNSFTQIRDELVRQTFNRTLYRAPLLSLSLQSSWEVSVHCKRRFRAIRRDLNRESDRVSLSRALPEKLFLSARTAKSSTTIESRPAFRRVKNIRISEPENNSIGIAGPPGRKFHAVPPVTNFRSEIWDDRAEVLAQKGVHLLQ